MATEVQPYQETKLLLGVAALAAAIALGLGLFVLSGSALVALTGTFGLLALIGSLASTEIALYAAISVACFDGVIKGLHTSALTLILKDLFIAIALLHWVWESLQNKRHESLSNRVAIPAIIFALWCGAEMFNTATASPLVALAGFRSWVLWLPVFFIAYDSLKRREQMRRMVMFIAVISALTGVYGMVQRAMGFQHLHSLSSGFGFYERFAGGVLRAPGSYVHPSAAGEAMSFAALLCGALVVASRTFSLRQIILLVACPICLGAMGASGARASFVGLLAGSAAFLILTGRVWWVVGVAVALTIVITQSGNIAARVLSPRYSKSRLNMRVVWNRSTVPFRLGTRLLMDSPLGTGVATGRGVGRMREVVDEPLRVRHGVGRMVENELGRAMKELGLPGAALFVWLLWRVLTGAISGWRNTTGRWKLTAAALTAGCFNIALQLMVGSALYMAPGGIYFWLAAAMAARMPDYQAQHQQGASRTALHDSAG